MQKYKIGMICPGFKHFNLKVTSKDTIGNEDDKPSMQYTITLSPKTCDMCQCAIIRSVKDGVFHVRCNFDDLKKTLDTDKEYYDAEIAIWKLRLEVLQGDSPDVIVDMAREDRVKDMEK